jgi:CO/xanthine dehydrogenase Mo-binding subunit
VNPDGVKAQMEGAIIFGLSAALKGEITIENGRVKQSNFHDYEVLRINEAPKIEIHIMESPHPVTGVGEPGVPPIAPALANAIFAATGKRLRKLPLNLSNA